IRDFHVTGVQTCALPISKQVVTESGKVLMTAQEIKDGQNVWQSMGGQQVGSIWGHGAYVAPDWSADWLHREAVIVGESIAQQRRSEERRVGKQGGCRRRA